MPSVAHRLPVGGGGWLDRTLNKERSGHGNRKERDGLPRTLHGGLGLLHLRGFVWVWGWWL